MLALALRFQSRFGVIQCIARCVEEPATRNLRSHCLNQTANCSGVAKSPCIPLQDFVEEIRKALAE